MNEFDKIDQMFECPLRPEVQDNILKSWKVAQEYMHLYTTSKKLDEEEELDFSDKHEPVDEERVERLKKVFLTLEEHQEKYTQEVLEYCAGNKRKAAKILGVSRTTLWRIEKK